MRVAVLLATYNGERFLAEQLDSILEQSHEDLILLVRDDGSSDGSLALLEDYRARHPRRLQLLETVERGLGASGNFAALMQYALDHKQALGLDRAYLMLADQDDYWYPDKIARQVQAMVDAEARHPGQPVLVHSDLRVVTEARESIAESFMLYQGLDAGRRRFGQLLLSNIITGCTAFMNEELTRRALPIPAEAIMHDWWLCLVAGAFGQIESIPEALVDYRQHGSNTIGAQEFKPARKLSDKAQRQLQREAQQKLLIELSHQARLFLDRHRHELSARQRAALRLTMQMRTGSGLLQRLLLRSLHRLGV